MRKNIRVKKLANLFLTAIFLVSLLLIPLNAFAEPVKAEITSENVLAYTCTPSDNLIINYGAEDAESENDFMNSSDNFQYWGSITADKSYSGEKSYVLNGEKWGSWSGTRITPTVSIQPNTDYTFSFRYNVTGASDGDYTYKYGFGKLGSANDLRGDHGVEKDGEWHLATASFNSKDDTVFELHFLVADSSKLYLDDFYLFPSDKAIVPDFDTSVKAKILEENPAKKYALPADNLIYNHGIEKGSEFWVNQKGYSWGALKVVDEDSKFEDYSLRFTPTLNEGFSDAEFSVKIEENTDYVFSVWMKVLSTETNPGALTSLNFDNPNGKKDVFELPNQVNDDWYQYSIKFNSGDRKKLTFNTLASTANLKVYFDDFYLVKAEKATAERTVITDHPPYVVCARENNLFDNYNLESNDYSYWERVLGFDFALVSISDAQAHSGKKSVLFKGKGTEWQSTEFKKSLKPNTDYTISVWVKGEGGTNSILGFIGILPDEKLKWLTAQDQVIKNGEWYQVSLAFNSKNYTDVVFYLGGAGAESGDVYVDDFYLFETKHGLASLPASEDPNAPYIRDNVKVPDSGQNFIPVAFAFVVLTGSAIIVLFNKKRRTI